VFPDIHFGEHSETAVACALKAHEITRPALTIQLGDILDAAAFSTHDVRSLSRDSTYDFMTKEVEPARDFTDTCLKRGSRFVQLGGNHEYRIERFCIRSGMAGAASYRALTPSELLGEGRSKKEYEYVPYVHSSAPMSYYEINKSLVAVHGWSFSKSAADVHLAKSRSKSVVFGHIHRQQLVSSRDPYSHMPIKAFSPGCLSKLQPLYAVGGCPTDWTHGFCLIYMGKRSWTEYLITIHNGVCVLPDGTEVRA
jgi:hypothetical protein